MGSKSLKIAFITMLFPIIGMAQGVAFRKADTALVTNDAGALRVFKSKPYYSSLLALKVKYTDTLTKIATKANLLPYALISNSVLLTGNQTVGGIKTFSSSMVLNGLTSSAAVGIGITPLMPLHVKGQFRVERISAVQYTQIDHEAGATTILSKNTVSSIYSSINISQGNNTTDRNVINIDGNGKVAMAFAASVATAPSAATDVVRKTELDLKANLASPALTGTPTSTTAAYGTNTTQIATTEFVQSSHVSGSFSGVGTATTTFTVTIGTTQANTSYKVTATPTNALSSALFYIASKTTTTFNVVYLAGLTGTVQFDWILAR